MNVHEWFHVDRPVSSSDQLIGKHRNLETEIV